MNLIEWTSVPEDSRRELVIQWYKNNQWEQYEDLATQAAKALKKELRLLSEVTNVQIGAGKVIYSEHPAMPLSELILNVCTVLSESSVLEQLPSLFAGFRVEQLHLGDKRDAFLRTWKCLFKELKGWDEKETLRWAKKWSDELEGRTPSNHIYHEGPVKMALSGLVDERARKAAGNNLSRLEGEILSVIWNATGNSGSPAVNHPNEVDNYDWKYVRQQVEKIVEEYGKENTL